MATTSYTSDLGLPKFGRNTDEKETVNADALELINRALGGYLAVASGDATYTLQDVDGARESRTLALKLTSTLTAARTIKIPIDAAVYRNRLFIIWNATAGGFKVTIKTTDGASTGVDITNGFARAVWHDGTNVYAFGPEISPTTGLVAPSSLPFIGARAYNNANISVADNTLAALTFNSERYDTNTIHDTGSNTDRLTLPFAGKWRIGGHVRFAANATGSRLLSIGLNGISDSDLIAGHQSPAAPGGSLATLLSLSTEYNFAANDYVKLVVYQNSGGSLNAENGGKYSPEFWCSYLGA